MTNRAFKYQIVRAGFFIDGSTTAEYQPQDRPTPLSFKLEDALQTLEQEGWQFLTAFPLYGKPAKHVKAGSYAIFIFKRDG